MNSSHPSDVSLYELAVNSEQPPQPLQLSPTTFKSLVGLLFDFLIEQNLPTTMWLKLPRGEVWQAEVDRFCQLTTAPYSIYNLQTYQKPSAVNSSYPVSTAQQPIPQQSTPPLAANIASSGWAAAKPQNRSKPGVEDFNLEDVTLDDLPNLPDAEQVNHPADDAACIQNLPLAADSQLKREYFVLIVSPAFYGLVLAHRPRSIRGLTESAGKGVDAEDNLDRKHPLLGICSFDQAVIQKVLEAGINTAICFGQANTASSANLQELLISWDELKQQQLVETLDPVLMGKLLTKQIQRQEELWRSSVAQRRQAETLPLLQQENEELQGALRSKDEFVKTIGLELRTPLSTMKTALSLLNNSPNLKQPQRQRYMDMLSQQCDRQSSLISGVLDLVQLESEVEQTPMEPVRLSEVVPGVVSTYQPLAQEKGVMLGYVVPEDLPPVSCSVAWVKQIVINLLHNSIKFTPKGGQVWVRAKQQGESIQIEFRDSGIGIAASDIPRIFERFYRVRNVSVDDSNGVGLGLSIVQQLLLRSGGSIAVKSKQGEGSVFTVLLPIHQ